MTNLTCHNISSRTLSAPQKQVLGLGLNMVLQPKTESLTALQDSWSAFARAIRLRCQFGISPAPRFRVSNPDFEPQAAPPEIEHVISDGCRSLQAASYVARPVFTRSLSRVHLQALSELRRDKSLVVKPADKNLGLTVMDASTYRAECLKHLADTSVYVRETPCIPSILAALENILRAADGTSIPRLTRRFFRHCPKHGYKPALFYVLMKLHKTPPVGRPIAASHSWVTYNVSAWLDAELRKIVVSQPTYLKDSTTFVLLFEETPVPNTALLFTYDVSALYPSIPTHTALSLIHQMLLQALYPKTEVLMPLLHWVLSNSFVEFDGETYKQVRGTAMGTPVAPAFATLFMSALDRQLTSHPDHACALHHRRFIDDGAGIWTGTRESLLSWLEYFNSLIPEIKLTWNISEFEMIFMDVRLYKGSRFHDTGVLDMETYQKLLNKYLYVPYWSYHPVHSKKGFITSELKRYVIRSSDAQSFGRLRQEFFLRLRARGYPNWFLLPLFESVPFSLRSDLLQGHSNRRRAPSGPVDRSPRASEEVGMAPPLVFKALYEPLTKALRPRQLLQPLVDRLHSIRPDIFGARVITAWSLPKKIGQHLVSARFQSNPI